MVLLGESSNGLDSTCTKQESKSPGKTTLGQKRTVRQGIPQGGKLSPALFLIFIFDILHRMPKNRQGAIYADDLASWSSEEYITTANYRLQQALQVSHGPSHGLLKPTKRRLLSQSSAFPARSTECTLN